MDYEDLAASASAYSVADTHHGGSFAIKGFGEGNRLGRERKQSDSYHTMDGLINNSENSNWAKKERGLIESNLIVSGQSWGGGNFSENTNAIAFQMKL